MKSNFSHGRCVSIFLLSLALTGTSCAKKAEQQALFQSEAVYGLREGIMRFYDWSRGKKGSLIREEENIGSGAFDSDSGEFKGPFLVEITEAVFVDPIHQLQVRFEEGDVWSALIPKNNDKTILFQVNPFTTIAKGYADILVQNLGLDANAAILRANQAVSDHLAGILLLRDIPVDPRHPLGAVDRTSFYGIALMGFSMLSHHLAQEFEVSKNRFTVRELIRGLLRDLKDGGLDGRNHQDIVEVEGVQFDPFVFSNRFSIAIRDFLNDSSLNRSGFVAQDVSELLDSVSRANGELFQSPTAGIDRLSPFIEIRSPSDGDAVRGILSIEIVASDADGFVKSIEAFYGGLSVIDEDPVAHRFLGNVSTDLVGDGAKVIRVIARDVAGHEEVKEIVVVGDNGIPGVTLYIDDEVAGQGQVVGGALTIVAQVSDAISADLAKISSSHPNFSNQLVDRDPSTERFEALVQTNAVYPGGVGSFPVKVMGTDLAGNTVEEEYMFQVDNTGPDITIQSPAENLNVTGLIHFSLQASSPLGVSSIDTKMIMQDGSQVPLVDIQNSPEIFVSQIDGSAWQDQRVTLQADAIDNKGNIATQSIQFGLNNTLFDSFHSINRMGHPWQQTMNQGKIGLDDINGDGNLDLWVTNGFSWNTNDTYTMVNIWDPLNVTWQSGQWWTTFAPEPSFREDSNIGSNYVDTCDVNGDGIADGVWGAPWHNGYPYPGRAWVGLGPQSSNGTWSALINIESPAQPSEEYFYFGHGVQCMDFNNDGLDDVTSRGVIYLGPSFSQSLDLRLFVYMTPSGFYANPLFQDLGDIDGDGVGDFLVMIDQTTTRAFRVLYGPVAPGALLQWGATHSGNYPFATEDIKRLTMPLGDVNGDGLNDYGFLPVSNGSGLPSSDPNDGELHVVFGSSARPLNPPVLELRNGNADVTYRDTHTSGDFNGDGFSDVAIRSKHNGLANGDDWIVVVLLGPGLVTERWILEPASQSLFWGRVMTSGDLLKKGRDALLIGDNTCTFGSPCLQDIWVYQDVAP